MPASSSSRVRKPLLSASSLRNISRTSAKSSALVCKFAMIEQTPDWNVVVFLNAAKLALMFSCFSSESVSYR